MKKTILVTGGAGYIGSHATLLLSQKGYEVIILDDLLYNQPSVFPWATFIKSDITQETLKNIFEKYSIDAVMHFAASINLAESFLTPIDYYENNVAKTIMLLQTMKKYKIRNFIFSSSCAIYGNPLVIPISEEHPIEPITPYGKTKAMIELILSDACHAQNIQFVSLRYFNAAGALAEYNLKERHQPETHLIPLAIKAAYEQIPFTIYGVDHPTQDGSCIRDYLHVWDIAQAHYLALEHLEQKKPSDYFNLGTGLGYSVKQILEAIQEITQKNIRVYIKEPRSGDPAILIANPEKAKNILNWKPTHSDLKFIIKSAVYAYKTDELLASPYDSILAVN